MQISLRRLLTQYGRLLQAHLFPALAEELGSLTEKHQQLVETLGLLPLETYVPGRRCGVGRPQEDRRALARAFVAKAVYGLTKTRDLLSALRTDVGLRRICGWQSAQQVPHESVFSRVFAEFARTELPQRLHAALIEMTQAQRLIGHVSRDATAIAARERPVVGAARPQPAPVAAKPRRKRGEPKPVGERTRIEKQLGMSLEQMLADLPRHCTVGCKTNSHGRKETWRGYKLHLDVADGQIPISCILTSASLHDSQAAIPLATMTTGRVTHLYDLMDSAYDSQWIRQHSAKSGHVPIIERLKRGSGLVPMAPHEAARFRERTGIERVYARLKDEFGGRTVWVRGHAKVMAHLMFAVLALTVDQILRLNC
jgi:hypothetical protein